MSLHDRNYARGDSGSGWSGSGGGDALRRVSSLFNWSFPIGRFFGIRVRVHILFIILAVTEVWPSQRLIDLGVGAGEQMLWNVRWIALLFGSVLLHEFGHCFGCRWVGGQADDILMWPLGGLAFCSPPRRPWPEFVTVACGPLVNVVLAGASFLTLWAWVGADALPISLDPFHMWPDAYWLYERTTLVRLLADLFVVNYALLLFNICLIFYPFDGGRLVQIGLWKWLGYLRSMQIATMLGMGGAIVVAGVGLWQANFMLVLIAVFGFITCMQQRRMLRHARVDELEDEDPRYAAAYETQTGRRGAWFKGGATRGDGGGRIAGWREARQAKAAAKAQRQQQDGDAAINRILDKVHASGLQSLTARERDTLQRATDRQRGAR